MPRIARLVIPGIPHHIIQRGNRRQPVFFSNEGKSFYLKIRAKLAPKPEDYQWSSARAHVISIDDFIRRLEEITGRTLMIQRPGRRTAKSGK
jgi:hypothetical protein